MKRFLFVILCLMVLLPSMLISIAGAVPSSVPSAVNFCQLSDIQYRVIFEQYSDSTLLASSTYYPRGNVDVGGFDLRQISESPLQVQPGQELRFNVRVDQEHKDFFEYLNDHDTYYMSASVQLYNMSTNTTTAVNVDEILIQYIDEDTGQTVSVSGTSGFRKFAYTDIAIIEFRASYNEAPFVYHGVQLRGMTIYQNNPIYDLVGNVVTNAFTPFNITYFDFQEAYDEGYNYGYVVGSKFASDEAYASGYQTGYEEGMQEKDPIKNWGEFALQSVESFMDFEIFPNFPLWGLLAVVVTVPLAITFLKIFAGG